MSRFLQTFYMITELIEGVGDELEEKGLGYRYSNRLPRQQIGPAMSIPTVE